MAEKKLTDGSLALEQKKKRVITIQAAEMSQDIKLRVAAYARVSSASDDQLNSFAAQNKYYTSLISAKDNWSMVDIYADEGITGTSVEKREDFKRLLADCRRGKVDRVLVKSISRFSRNTKECLESIRELKSLGVSIYFEKENIDTATMSGEMMTALFASFAQAESESISGNMRWSYQKRMQNGAYVPSSVPYGYTMIDGRMEIDVERARIVCEIFADYLSGLGCDTIAKSLSQHPTAGVDRKWQRSTVSYILTNERYTGDSLWQKQYTTGALPFKRVRNHGQQPQYYAECTHPAIITKEVFQAAQELFQKRKEKYGHEKTETTILTRKLTCGTCGSSFRKKGNDHKVFWTCVTHDRDRQACTITQIPETEIHAAFMRMYFKLKNHGQPILRNMLSNLQTIRNRRMLWSVDVIELNKKISELTSQNQLLTTLKQQGLVDSDIFISQSNSLAEQIRATKLEKERLLDTERDEAIDTTKAIMEVIDGGPVLLSEFDEGIFDDLVERIIVDSCDCIRFCLKNGLELKEPIERTVR